MASIPHLPTHCLLESPETCSRYIIWYQCQDVCMPPVIVNTPPPGASPIEAYIYVDARIFPRLTNEHYKELYDLGIRRIQVMSYDGVQYEPITNGFVSLESQRQHTPYTTEEDINARTGIIIFIILVILIIMGRYIII